MANENSSVFVIADYGVGDPAFAEVNQRIAALAGNPRIENISVAPFSTVQTGFWAYQMALNHNELARILRDGHNPKSYLFLNTAPRKDDAKPRNGNAGEPLVYAKLEGGMEVVGVMSGESFSYLKPIITEFREILVPNEGSQFRSRDIFPQALASIMRSDYSILGNKIEIDNIPERIRWLVAHIDGYGNMKLSTAASEAGLRKGEKISVRLCDKSIDAVYSDGIFHIDDGTLCIAPGSSGKKGDPFLEISERSGNAWKRFASPQVESTVKLMRLTENAKTLRLRV